MLAVYWHSYSHTLWSSTADDYEKLCLGFKKNFNAFGVQVVHLTTKDAPRYGDTTIQYNDLNPKDIFLNREIAFRRFLGEYPLEGETVLFTEPDARLLKMFPPLEGDVALLLRPNDGVAITPSFRLAKRSALPFFDLTLEMMKGQRTDWHGDSVAWAKAYGVIGAPKKFGIHEWNGLKIELREYAHYSKEKSKFIRHYKFTTKAKLIANEAS